MQIKIIINDINGDVELIGNSKGNCKMYEWIGKAKKHNDKKVVEMGVKEIFEMA